jgi:hypothetical protein
VACREDVVREEGAREEEKVREEKVREEKGGAEEGRVQLSWDKGPQPTYGARQRWTSTA